MVGLPGSEKSLICSATLIQYWHVIGEQTNILQQHSPHYAHALHGNNINCCWIK